MEEIYGTPDHFILVGHEVVPATMMGWADWLQNNSKARIVAKTETNGWRVSTVFLGLNHQYGDGPPLVFETMVFIGKTFDERWMDRCSTWEEAEAMHKRGVEWANARSVEEEA